ncbi:Fic family protein [Candidatus Dependentiae bacterium]|jgi:Fic family protein|nr:Fic family protein [Candidatus Dependentiae bacterium]
MVKFDPRFSITPQIVQYLMRIEAAKQEIAMLPITPTVLANLRETARLASTHYSTMIEGNRLTQEEVKLVLKEGQSYAGRERDDLEVKGYYAALDMIEHFCAQGKPLTEKVIQKIHGLVIGGGKKIVSPTPYRDGQNVIRDAATRRIVYLPPEAQDVLPLMHALIVWIKKQATLPAPLVAALAHYQLATIHPYYDGNGRTARLLATLILHMRGYDLKRIYSLDEYYAHNLNAYYQALSVGPSHNYYEGRAQADVTDWVNYFCAGMAESCEKIRNQARGALQRGKADQSQQLRLLDSKQRKALDLFRQYKTVSAQQIGAIFGFKPRTSSELCRRWVDDGFLVVVDTSRKARTYQLAAFFSDLLNS